LNDVSNKGASKTVNVGRKISDKKKIDGFEVDADMVEVDSKSESDREVGQGTKKKKKKKKEKR
jgi:hypothetical protein